MKEKIICAAKENDASAVGVCSCEEYLKRAPDAEAETVLQGARSVIVCLFGYYNGEKRGNISRYAQGEDYHKVTVGRMQKIAEVLVAEGWNAKAFADIGKLNERLLARLSGLAYRGRNGMAINDRLGSYFFIGYIVTDCPIEPDSEETGTCMECGKCIAACPGGALSEKGFKKEKCLSEITQRKGMLLGEEEALMLKAGTAWGCDVCQEVCPHNNAPELTKIAEFRENLIYDLDIDENISNKEFKRMYGNRAFSWRGKNVVIRNQKIFQKSKKNSKKGIDKREKR